MQFYWHWNNIIFTDVGKTDRFLSQSLWLFTTSSTRKALHHAQWDPTLTIAYAIYQIVPHKYRTQFKSKQKKLGDLTQGFSLHFYFIRLSILLFIQSGVLMLLIWLDIFKVFIAFKLRNLLVRVYHQWHIKHTILWPELTTSTRLTVRIIHWKFVSTRIQHLKRFFFIFTFVWHPPTKQAKFLFKGSEVFSYFTSLHTTALILLSIFSLLLVFEPRSYADVFSLNKFLTSSLLSSPRKVFKQN